jgi:hypothetical protein
LRTLGVALALLVASACTIGIEPNGSPVGCPLAVIEGTLVGQGQDSLSLVTDDGEAVDVDWSDAVSIRAGSPIELVDANGVVIARAGDRVAISGGILRGQGTWTECGGVRVKPSAS